MGSLHVQFVRDCQSLNANIHMDITLLLIPEAFKANGVEWASQLTAFGEVFTLPVVVLISVVIQPRLQYALG